MHDAERNTCAYGQRDQNETPPIIGHVPTVGQPDRRPNAPE
jgi:hypothetical protein